MKINLNKDIVNFEGMALKTDNGQSLKMKTILLGYISAVKKMAKPLMDDEKRQAYELGLKIGKENREIELTDKEIELLQRITKEDPMDDVFFILEQTKIELGM